MSGIDLVLAGAVALCVLLAVRSMRKRKENGGGCCGNCSACGGKDCRQDPDE